MSIDRSRWRLPMVGALALTLAALLVPVAARAEQQPATRGPIQFQPVTLDGTTYKPSGDGPFKTDFPNGIDASKEPRKHVTASIGTRVSGKAYKWGSVAAPSGSFILNNSAGPICKLVIKSTSTTKFDIKEITVGDGWDKSVSADGLTLTLTAKKDANCIPKGGHFWMKVPEAAQPSTGGSTLEGTFYDKIAMAEPPPGGDDTTVVLVDVDLFQDVVAADTTSDSSSAVVQTSPSASPSTPSSSVPATAPPSPAASSTATLSGALDLSGVGG